MRNLRPIFIFLLLLTLSACSGTKPNNLGVKDGQLLPCPAKPNCASSQATDESQKVDPIQMEGDLETSKTKLKKVLSSLGSNTIIQEKENYMHVEFTSAIFKFVDDVEFYFNSDKKVIDMRSASRIGYSDLGVNKKRLNQINFEFVQM